MPQTDKYSLTWADVRERLKKIPDGLCYGIPRGGAIVAGLTGRAVDSPEQADFLVEDVIDSGKTAEHYTKVFGKPVFALVNKQAECSLGTWVKFPWEEAPDVDIRDTVIRQLEFIGEDATREGLKETPARVVKSWKELYAGYSQDPKKILERRFSCDNYDEMVIMRNVRFFSTCEHHMLPFFGSASIGYIPNGKVVGASKLIRLVECYARRLQIQERMTAQIGESLEAELSPKGVGVVIRATHLCMMVRGVKRDEAEFTTSYVQGVLRESGEAPV